MASSHAAAVEAESVSDCTTTPESEPEPGEQEQGRVSGRRLEDASEDEQGPGTGHDDDEGAAAQQSVSSTPRGGRRTSRLENNSAPGFSPNFRSAAAMAGWDDEALLLAQESPAAGAPQLKQSTPGRGTPSRATSCSEGCTQCPQCRERKRATRTPGQAATPLSAGRRHRRVRRVSSNEEPLVPIPMAVLVDEGDKRGASSRTAECSHQQPSQDKESRGSQARAKTAEEAGGGNNRNENALQLDKLREELTCVVCLDICFEPSTTTCGHSFCRGCLHSAFQRCGMRCPKCRQELSSRAISKNDCPINTVLWNTIQLLFPQETAARRKDQKQHPEVHEDKIGSESQPLLRPGLVRRRVSRPIPWRELATSSERARPPVLPFGSAPDVLESGRLSAPSYANSRFVRVRVRRPASSAAAARPQSVEGPRSVEDEDAALAARLEQSFI